MLLELVLRDPGITQVLTFINTMFVALTLLLTLAAPPAQIRRLYIEHLKDEALRDAATIVRASESLTHLFASWSGSKLTRQEFARLAGQRLELIRKSSRHLSENPLVARIDRVKKPNRKSESGNASESSSELSLEEIPSTLDQIAQKARMVRKGLEQLTRQPSREAPGGPQRGPSRTTVTVGELQAPRIRDLCKEMRAAAEKVSERFRTLDSRY